MDIFTATELWDEIGACPIVAIMERMHLNKAKIPGVKSTPVAPGLFQPAELCRSPSSRARFDDAFLRHEFFNLFCGIWHPFR